MSPLKSLVAAALLWFVSPAAALANMTDAEIVEVVSGKTVRLATRWGSFPLIYRPNKTVSGNGKALGLARFFAPEETGRWFVRNDRLCQQFPTWYDGKTNCFRLRRTGPNSLSWTRDDGYSGTATVN